MCCSCGACKPICPANAIEYKETVGGYLMPIVSEKLCNSCGLCISICPGRGFTWNLGEKRLKDLFTGEALATLVGKATGQELLENSQSGGVASSLLACALDSDEVSAVVTVVMEEGISPRPKVQIVQSVDALYASQKSKYCPVPLWSIIKELKKIQGPVAVVALPCQIHALWNLYQKLPWIRKKIRFTIGLVCDRIMTYAAVDHLLSDAKMSAQVRKGLYYRDKKQGGYPGNVHVFSEEGKSIILPAGSRIRIKDFYTPLRCRLCFDKMNIFSDITVGDPHSITNVDRKNGETVAIARTTYGLELLSLATERNYIKVRQIEYSEVIHGQSIEKKRKEWRSYVEAWKQKGHEVPNFYEAVKKDAFIYSQDKVYLSNLQYSANLDNFDSREALLRYVKRKLKLKLIQKTFLYPLELPKIVADKAKFLSKLIKKGRPNVYRNQRDKL
jgi:coenzyme F420 hydrogenase subunit beta